MHCRTGAAEANADGHRLSPESNPILASTQTAFACGCQELGGPRTKAAEGNSVAEATILHACSWPGVVKPLGRKRQAAPDAGKAHNCFKGGSLQPRWKMA